MTRNRFDLAHMTCCTSRKEIVVFDIMRQVAQMNARCLRIYSVAFWKPEMQSSLYEIRDSLYTSSIGVNDGSFEKRYKALHIHSCVFLIRSATT